MALEFEGTDVVLGLRDHRCMAANQLGSETLLDSKIVPLTRLH